MSDRDDNSAAGVSADILAAEYLAKQDRVPLTKFAADSAAEQLFNLVLAEGTKPPVRGGTLVFAAFNAPPRSDNDVAAMEEVFKDLLAAGFKLDQQAKFALTFEHKSKNWGDDTFEYWVVAGLGAELFISYTTHHAVEMGKYQAANLFADVG